MITKLLSFLITTILSYNVFADGNGNDKNAQWVVKTNKDNILQLECIDKNKNKSLPSKNCYNLLSISEDKKVIIRTPAIKNHQGNYQTLSNIQLEKAQEIFIDNQYVTAINIFSFLTEKKRNSPSLTSSFSRPNNSSKKDPLFQERLLISQIDLNSFKTSPNSASPLTTESQNIIKFLKEKKISPTLSYHDQFSHRGDITYSEAIKDQLCQSIIDGENANALRTLHQCYSNDNYKLEPNNQRYLATIKNLINLNEYFVNCHDRIYAYSSTEGFMKDINFLDSFFNFLNLKKNTPHVDHKAILEKINKHIKISPFEFKELWKLSRHNSFLNALNRCNILSDASEAPTFYTPLIKNIQDAHNFIEETNSNYQTETYPQMRGITLSFADSHKHDLLTKNKKGFHLKKRWHTAFIYRPKDKKQPFFSHLYGLGLNNDSPLEIRDYLTNDNYFLNIKKLLNPSLTPSLVNCLKKIPPYNPDKVLDEIVQKEYDNYHNDLLNLSSINIKTAKFKDILTCAMARTGVPFLSHKNWIFNRIKESTLLSKLANPSRLTTGERNLYCSQLVAEGILVIIKNVNNKLRQECQIPSSAKENNYLKYPISLKENLNIIDPDRLYKVLSPYLVKVPLPKSVTNVIDVPN